MTEVAPDAPTEPTTPEPEQGKPVDGEDALGDAGKQALDRMKAERAEATKQLKAVQRELDEMRKASMSETEKAVAEAEERGRTAAASEFGQELARARFDALAGRRNAEFDTTKALEYVDLGKFLGEDGRPDDKAIAAAVERLVPAAPEGPPSFDGGTRTPTAAPQGGMTGLIRKAAGRA